MIPEEQIKVMTEAMKMCEAELRQENDDETIALAKTGISAMIQTVIINGTAKNMDVGRVMSVALALLRTLDMASDHAAGAGIRGQDN